VTVTFEAAPAPTTNPVELTVTQALELPQVADLVTSLVLLVYVAVAFICTLGGTEKVLAPPAVVTAIEFGWFTKNPVHPGATTSNDSATNAAIRDSFRPELSIML